MLWRTVGLALAAAITAAAQTAAYKAPRTADGHPDLNGIWQALNTANWDLQDHSPAAGPVVSLGAAGAIPPGQGVVEGGEIPYQAWALAKKKENFANRLTADPEIKCYLPGVPRATYLPLPFQILQGAKSVMMAYEYAGTVRNIPLNNAGPSPAPAWMGWSMGHWEGDTLVVDVTRMTDETWLGDNGLFHSRKLHVTERLRRVGDTIQYQVTAEDPEVLQKPWTLSRTLTLQRDALEEAPPCVDYDAGHYVNQEHHDNGR
jgi:hypothetical protein